MIQSYALLLIAVAVTVGAQLLLKAGMNQIGEVQLSLAGVSKLITQAVTNYYVIGALFALATSFLMWLVILSKVKLSVAIPFTALNYVFILFFSWMFLRETISAPQLIGVMVIIFGLFLVVK